ncbi:MAG: HesA/MoeB/ThiF family protein [Pseudomonadota bacterium]
MGLVLISMAFWVWVLRRLSAPQTYIWGMVAAVVLGIFAVHIILPLGHPAREALGGTLRPWGILAGFGVIVWLYTRLLSEIRQRSASVPDDDTPKGPFSTTELDRYARHIVLREIGGGGQQRLKMAKVLVVGAGGLGAPILQYLAAAGVGQIGMIDKDVVCLSNLQRQVLFNEDDLEQPKVLAAARHLSLLNPNLEFRPYNRHLDANIAADLLGDYDLVLDGTDDFATRALVNATCVRLGLPLVSGAISQWEGQVTVVDSAAGTPCMHCLFPKEPAKGTASTCAEGGVLGALPGIIGSIMAAEAIKLITGAGAVLKGRMLIYDALYAETRIIDVARRTDCIVCGSKVK